MLPVNYADMLLLVLAVGLFIAELFTASFESLTAGGLFFLISGSLILFRGGILFTINPIPIAFVAVVIIAFFVFVAGARR